MSVEVKCWFCGRGFRRKSSVEQHQKDRKGNCRIEGYQTIHADENMNKQLRQFHDDKADLCIGSRRKSKGTVQRILDNILYKDNRDRYDTEANLEGSYKTGLKIGKPDEFDFSVGLMLPSKHKVTSTKSVGFQYLDDDVDEGNSPVKRSLGERQIEGTENTLPPCGYKVVQMNKGRTKRFGDSIIQGVLVPYEVLKQFHQFVSRAVDEIGDDTVTVGKYARGPAISLIIKADDIVHTITVDVTPVIFIGIALPELRDLDWPRARTLEWLSEAKIEEVQRTEIYLVPKGDKFWKVSFARCENEILRDVDGTEGGAVRKTCLRICKMKLKQWKSKSVNGLKAISSYMLKTLLLWLCELLPHDADWHEDKLSARYVNFMMELRYCLRNRCLQEYFVPNINLLESKDDDDIEEMLNFIQDELQKFAFMTPEWH